MPDISRIYQGRVSRIEKSNGEGKNQEFVPLDDWESALWDHHVLFQDAVNYYLVALLSLVHSADNPLNPILERIGSDDPEYHAWEYYVGRGIKRKGLRDFMEPYIDKEHLKKGMRECLQAFLAIPAGKGPKAEVLDLALRELLHSCSGDGKIQQEGRSMLPRFCRPDYTGSFPHDSVYGDRTTILSELPRWIHDHTYDSNPLALADMLSLEHFVNTTPGYFKAGEEARGRLREALDWLYTDTWGNAGLSAQDKERISSKIDALPDDFTLPNNKKYSPINR